MKPGDVVFAAYPTAVLYSQKLEDRKYSNKELDGLAVQHLLWGDFAGKIIEKDGDWVHLDGRGGNAWARRGDLQSERLLEIGFVDVGQGDGCMLVTPDDKLIVIDAGAGDNMYRFLRWRFGGFRRSVHFDAVVITHPDMDHYEGFRRLFEEPMCSFGAVYHNGIVERVASGDKVLGELEPANGAKYLTEIAFGLDEMRAVTEVDAKTGKKLYPRLLRDLDRSGRAGMIRQLSATDGFMPGYEADKAVAVRVLGPVLDDLGGRRVMRWFGDPGKTKNGHSVVLHLTYGRLRVLLGGDLNVPAENHLLAHHGGVSPEGLDARREAELIRAARAVFESDVAKSCHHGSGDFSEVFLAAVNAAATVISSGDDESHSHPRADTLGTIGRYGFGPRPLLFNTELARSTKENIKHPFKLRKSLDHFKHKLKDLTERRVAGEVISSEEVTRTREMIDEVGHKLERSVTTFGMINLRSDGERALLAQRLERPRGPRAKWDIYPLAAGLDGRLGYVPKGSN